MPNRFSMYAYSFSDLNPVLDPDTGRYGLTFSVPKLELPVFDEDGIVDFDDPDGTTLAEDVTYGATTYDAGTSTKLLGTISFIGLDGEKFPVAIFVMGADAWFVPIGWQPQLGAQMIYDGSDEVSGDVTIDLRDIVPCFAAGTLVMTDHGDISVENLRIGDLIRTLDNGFQPIRWIGSRKIDLATASHLAPIRIRAGALGANTPSSDLLVSPQHRILIRSNIAHRMFGAAEILVAAKQLLQIDGIDIAEDMPEVHYFHVLFDRHEIVHSNGAETESLYTGSEAIKAVGAAAREEIFAIFPELQNDAFTPEPARTLASGRMGRKLVVRHAQNDRVLVS